jgi:hypothetical protein
LDDEEEELADEFVVQLHRHALLNSKRGLTVDEFGKKLDDEVSIISSQASFS